MGWIVLILALIFGKRILSSLVSLAVLAVVLIAGYGLLSNTLDLGALDWGWLVDWARAAMRRPWLDTGSL